MSAMRLLVVSGVLILLAGLGCKDKSGPVPVSEGEHETPTICIECKGKTVLHLAVEAKDERWPKQCPSCETWALYAYEECKNCAAPVPLRDSRTRGFGYPEVCPACGKPWREQ